jgi:IS1 family transposase
LWVAHNRRTRQVVAYAIGDRSAKNVQHLWARLPEPYRVGHSYSNLWRAYNLLVSTGTHQMVGKERGQTAHIERGNHTLRQRLARYVRKTLSFSKSDNFHYLVSEWFSFDYNLSLTP